MKNKIFLKSWEETEIIIFNIWTEKKIHLKNDLYSFFKLIKQFKFSLNIYFLLKI